MKNLFQVNEKKNSGVLRLIQVMSTLLTIILNIYLKALTIEKKWNWQ